MATKPARETRYLKRRGERWWVQIAVPSPLQSRFGKTVQKSLNTADLNEARSLRWAHVESQRRRFEAALNGEGLTADQIEAIAQDEYRRLAAMETFSADGGDIFSGDPVAHNLNESIWLAGCDLDDGDIGLVQQRVNEILSERGLSLDDETIKELGTALLRAQLNAYDNLLRQRNGLEPEPVGTLNQKRSSIKIPQPQSNAMNIEEATRGYVAAQTNWTHKTRQQCETSLRLFCEHMGSNATLTDVTRFNVSQFRSRLAQLSPGWARSSRSKGLHIERLLSLYGVSNGTIGLSDKTLARHLSPLHGLYDWAIRAGHFDGSNPATLNSVGSNGSLVGTDWQPYTDDEIATLFDGLKFEAEPEGHTHDVAMPWIMLIALYSGMRLEEICGLKVSDVKQSGDVWHFDLSGRRLKTSSGYRHVPIHSKVLNLGFVDYLQFVSGETYLFPSLGSPDKDGRRGTYMGKKFGTYRKRKEIKRDHVGFHSFRSTVATKLENAGVPEGHAARLVGHKMTTMTYGLYSGGLSLPELKKVVESIAFD